MFRRRAALPALTAALTALLLATAACGPDDPGGAAGSSGEQASASASASPTAEPRPEPEPLDGELETRRQSAAEELYGAALDGAGVEALPSFTKRKTSIVTLGDSEISGEGTGTYTKGTDGPVNYCHRSPLSAVHRTPVEVDERYDFSCSGAATRHVRETAQFPTQPAQTDALAVAARNTRVKLVALLVGANDRIGFGDVMADCISRRMLMRGPCAPKYAGGWQERVDGMVPRVTGAVEDVRTVMREAGYRGSDYKLVLMSYPSPIGPGSSGGFTGCLTYPQDGTWARSKAVPALAAGLRKAAREGGARFLDTSGLFKGHEACTRSPWVRGLTLGGSNRDNPAQGSYHPNAAGHRMFGKCLAEMYGTGLREARCTAPGGRTAVALTAM